ncbi:uncharacterized protein LOC123516302 isoform X1 [Portunus trituberculatus]|uniref:uncharacterized protein LOC123516302 isoform X1 n=1 Tax=Portunus trituberculatus TaxID=210409 RepID=UPI001E1CB8A9|nr:uncharacterized protein LOC123516302 isoform X1 [Portunus trituberculatus]XP_045131512.1 uncharacterized protein LOC123516302 isoform X1 [Portunus trituberculatus]XP_045131513.1 uncharacterized protein LOC123516302 isoform X1 [Portunus trituberculatus]
MQRTDMEKDSVWWQRYVIIVGMIIIGLGPTAFLMVAFMYESLTGSTTLALFSISCLCTMTAYLITQTYLRPRPPHHAPLTQTEDVESGQGDASSEDAPPIYETVVAKPPPYDSLYESCNLPVCGGDDEEAEPGVSDGSKDSDLPTYTQAAQALTPV